MRSLRMRTTLLLSLLLVAVSMTIVFLALVRITVQRQVNRELAEDTQRSEVTFANLQAQRRHLSERTAALMADLPSLKALMTARDTRTIADGGAEFWRVSGSSFFALSDQSGDLVSFYSDDPGLQTADVRGPVEESVAQPGTQHLLAARGRLIEVLSEPIEFGGGPAGAPLGSVTVGYSLDRKMATDIGEAAAAQVAFIGREVAVISTLDPRDNATLYRFARQYAVRPEGDLWIGRSHYLARTIPLTPAAAAQGGPYLLVLKSYDQAARTLRQLNLGVAVIGLLGLLIGSALAAAIARNVTRPLESLLEGTRALGSGDFHYQWKESGALEVRGLSLSFRRMQAEIQRTQRELLLAERMATIGRMASSISHDLRHYLTSMYANAEFLSMQGTSATAREEMLDEVKVAVVGMTDLLDTLLVFGRTGMAIHSRIVDVEGIVERAIARVRTHPEARNVELALCANEVHLIRADPQELDRAVYNVLLNGCQAAKLSKDSPRVTTTITEGVDHLCLAIEDNGPGIPASIRETMFQPFASEGKEHGTGLGLALSLRIVEAHGGSLRLQESNAGKTVFCLNLPLDKHELNAAATKHLEGAL